MTYKEKLLSPHWQRKRQDVLTRDNYACCLCSDTETTLHVHHNEYIDGHEPWEYPLENFLTLCKHCHKVVEYLKSGRYTPVVAGKSIRNGDVVVAMIVFRNDVKGIAYFHFDFFTEEMVCDFIVSESALSWINQILQLSEKLTTNAKKNDGYGQMEKTILP